MIGPEDQKISIDSFNGLYSRGSVDEVPLDHAQDCLNLAFTSEGHYRTRSGSTRTFFNDFSGGVRRFFMPEGLGGLLMLSSGGRFYLNRTLTGSSALIDTVSGALDFAALNIGNRTIYSPNNGFDGIANQHVRMWDIVLGISRDIAGCAPEQSSGSHLTAAASATAGTVTAGVHKIAVIYETNTGFWTPPGPKININASAASNGAPCTITTATPHGFVSGESHRISGGTGNWAAVNDVWHVNVVSTTKFTIPVDTSTFGGVSGTLVIAGLFTPASVTVDGTKKIDLTVIPTGGTFVTKRLILATRAGGAEYFFVPESDSGIIVDNTSTTLTLNFVDSDLTASADYLFDILEAIPVGTSLTKYKGRLVIADSFLDGINFLGAERLLLSNVDDPETFSYVSGYIQVQNENDGNNVRASFVLRDTLYAAKFTGLFATTDNGGDPSTWPVTVVDASVGGTNYCFSSFINSQTQSDTGDFFTFAHKAGLFLFNGVVQRPELSYKIQQLWSRINPNYFARVTVTHDIWNHRIYITAPLDNATDPNTLLVCDYSEGRTPKDVKWGIWQFPYNATCIGMTYLSSVNSYRFTYSTIDPGGDFIFLLDDSKLNDEYAGNVNGFLIAIDNFYKLAPMLFGGVGCFKHIKMRAYGVATALALTGTGVDGQNPTPFGTVALTTTQGRELDIGINFVNEKMSLKVELNAQNEYQVVDRIDIWGLQALLARPA